MYYVERTEKNGSIIVTRIYIHHFKNAKCFTSLINLIWELITDTTYIIFDHTKTDIHQFCIVIIRIK